VPVAACPSCVQLAAIYCYVMYQDLQHDGVDLTVGVASGAGAALNLLMASAVYAVTFREVGMQSHARR
jgi:hypothetical protein